MQGGSLVWILSFFIGYLSKKEKGPWLNGCVILSACKMVASYVCAWVSSIVLVYWNLEQGSHLNG